MSLNVVEFPHIGLNNMPAMLRKVADDIDAGEHGEAEALFVILETEHGLECFGFGATDDPFRNIGLLEAAKGLQIDLALAGEE